MRTRHKFINFQFRVVSPTHKMNKGIKDGCYVKFYIKTPSHLDRIYKFFGGCSKIVNCQSDNEGELKNVKIFFNLKHRITKYFNVYGKNIIIHYNAIAPSMFLNFKEMYNSLVVNIRSEILSLKSPNLINICEIINNNVERPKIEGIKDMNLRLDNYLYSNIKLLKYTKTEVQNILNKLGDGVCFKDIIYLFGYNYHIFV